jgi:hypothetical protein
MLLNHENRSDLEIGGAGEDIIIDMTNSRFISNFVFSWYCGLFLGEQTVQGSEADQSPSSSIEVNPLNAELNPICHLLILLGDLTFMGPCIVSISNKMQR